MAVNTALEFFHTKAGLKVCLILAALGIYLLWTHTGHMLAALPYFLLLACPLMHFLVMVTGTIISSQRQFAIMIEFEFGRCLPDVTCGRVRVLA
jgi:hypothetical protein